MKRRKFLGVIALTNVAAVSGIGISHLINKTNQANELSGLALGNLNALAYDSIGSSYDVKGKCENNAPVKCRATCKNCLRVYESTTPGPSSEIKGTCICGNTTFFNS